jgi:hypothetical protein
MMASNPFVGQLSALLAIALAVATPAFAQTDESSDSYPFRFAPVSLSPYVGLKNVGVDSNVYNDPSNKTSVTSRGLWSAGSTARYALVCCRAR